jgi:hypothetical protein
VVVAPFFVVEAASRMSGAISVILGQSSTSSFDCLDQRPQGLLGSPCFLCDDQRVSGAAPRTKDCAMIPARHLNF